MPGLDTPLTGEGVALLRRFVKEFYQATLHPHLLCTVVGQLTKSVKADVGLFLVRDCRQSKLFVNIVTGVDDSLSQRLENDFLFTSRGPWAGHAAALASGVAPPGCDAIFDPDAWCAELGHGLTSGLLFPVGDEGVLGVFRRHEHPDFTCCERDNLCFLADQLGPAATLLARSSERDCCLSLTTSLLHGLVIPLVVVDEQCRVIFCNQPARSLLDRRDGVVCSDGILSAQAVRSNGRLQTLIQNAVDSAAKPYAEKSLQGGFLSRGMGRQPMGLVVRPMTVAATALCPAQFLAAIHLVSPDPELHNSVDVLRGVFGLTPAEATLLQALLIDKKIEDHAAERRVSVTTVRTQLAHLFRKTGTNRQPELVRLASFVVNGLCEGHAA